MRVKARSRVTNAHQGRVEYKRRRLLTAIGSVFLIFALVCLSIVMLLKALPSWVLPEGDSIFVLVPADTSQATQIWIVVNRPAHRGSLLIRVPYSSDAPLGSGIFSDLPMQAWLNLDNTTSDTSQALGITVDEVMTTPADISGKRSLVNYARQQAWADVREGKFTTSLVVLAASAQNGTVAELDNLQSLPRMLDRNDVALLGDFNTCHFAVLNDTKQNGLASAVGEVLEQSGGQVIRLESSSALTLDSLRSEEDTSIQILVRPSKQEECALATKRAAGLFNATKIEESENVANRLRADVVLVLGEDINNQALFVTASEQYLLR